MKRYLIGFLLLIALLVVEAVLILPLITDKEQKRRSPDLLVIASTATQIQIVLPTSTETATPIATSTVTPSPTSTATLVNRIAAATIIMPDVTLPPSATPYPENMQILVEPPEPIEPLPDATLLPSPYTDFTAWVSFESDHPAVQYTQGTWTPIGSLEASRGQYHYSEDTNAKLRLIFNGEAIRIRYVSFTNGGVWNVLLDGMIVDVIDAYAPSGVFPASQIYYIGGGEHTLELHNTDTSNPASSGHMTALDAIQVYRPDNLTLIVPGGVLPTDTPTATLIPAEITLVQAPPSPQPTTTNIPIQVIGASIVIGYDENANSTLDTNEGVRGISVRLVEVGTNHVVAQAYTDERGFAQLQASTNAQVQLIVPYFGESWTLQSRSSGEPQTFTLLLSPGNQPGLIP